MSNETVEVDGDWLLAKGNSESKHIKKNKIRSQENVTVEIFNKQLLKLLKNLRQNLK